MKSRFDRDEFDNTWRKWQIITALWFVFVALFTLALTSGVIWVVYKVLLHFGVL